MPGGYHGSYLKIDASRREASMATLDEGVLRRFLGGVGLGAWLLAHEEPACTPPLSAQSSLVFTFSPLVGSPLTTSAKFAVVGISPLTGRFCDALSSSQFAITAKRTGADAIVLTGLCQEPSLVLIDGDSAPPSVSFVPANDLWGLTASEAESRIRSRLGNEWQVASIGVAGERQIPFATISHDGRHAGRGGLGAILGSKRIKAIAVRGQQRTELADPRSTIALAKSLSQRSLGSATEKYRELGTIANLLVFNRFNSLPTRNFQSGHFEGAERLVSVDLTPALRLARNSCSACTIGCEHVFALQSSSQGVRMEYESLFALGPLCGVDDPAFVLEAARICDDLGIDTISAGGTIAFLMDCAERGWIDAPWLRFGSGEAVLRALNSLVAPPSDVGRLLSLGSRQAAAEIGHDAASIAMHVKGLELPGYDPRRLHAMALGLSVGTRGADHNRSGAYEADFSNRVSALDDQAEPAANAAIESEDRAALIDSLILCKFLRGVFTDIYTETAEMLQAVTGWDVTAEELRRLSRRVVSARRLINEREGWTSAEDTLPVRLLAPDSGLSSPKLKRMIASYYAGRGCDEHGRLQKQVREALNLESPPFG